MNFECFFVLRFGARVHEMVCYMYNSERCVTLEVTDTPHIIG